MTRPDGHPLAGFLAGASGRTLVLRDPSVPLADLDGDDVTVRTVGLDDVPGAPRRWPAVALVAANALSLRRAVSVLPPLGRTRSLAWWLLEAEEPALLLPRPEWPPLVEALRASSLIGGGALTTVRTERPIGVNAVLEQVARTLTPGSAVHPALVVATTSRDPRRAPPADPALIRTDTVAAAIDPERAVPPDVVLTTDVTAGTLPAHDILGRAPTLVSEPDLLAAPLDEGLLNPEGFLRRPGEAQVELSADVDHRIRLRGAGIDERPAGGEVTPGVVAALRDHVGVRVRWADPAPAPLVHAVAALAMAGVPLIAPTPPSALGTPGARLGPRLAAALVEPADLTQPMGREEHSIRLRRAALLEHSTLAWRERLAGEAGIAFRRFPTCTVVVGASGPQQLEHALGQVARQRGADIEVVVVPDGFSPDEREVRRRAVRPATVVEPDVAAAPGGVLAAGVEAASGDLVVTMPEDAWWGPEVVADLLLARHYSGAALVDSAAGLVYDERRDRTLAGAAGSERTVTSLAGGPWLMPTAHLRELVRLRGPDQLSGAVIARAVRGRGDRVYRTHGLGCLVRVGGEESPDETALDDTWEGFRPGRLLELATADRPPTTRSHQ